MNTEENQVKDIFKELLAKYESKGVRQVRDGHTRVSVFGRQLRFDLSKSFPLLTHRQLFVRGIFLELMWMLRGQTDNQILKNQNVNIWTPWEGIVDKKNPTALGKIYGSLWRDFGQREIDEARPYTTECLEVAGFDQIEWVVNEIKTNPSSSRLIVSGWNPPVSTQTPKQAVLPCCHLLFQFFVEEMSIQERKEWVDSNYEGGGLKAISDYCQSGGAYEENEYRKEQIQELGFVPMLNSLNVPTSKLSCQLYQRSSDCTTASGYNIAAYALLTHMVAQQCDLAVGEFIWTTGDIHVYGNQIEDLRLMIERDTHPFPQIKINKAKDLYSYEWSDIEIINYTHSGKIENLKVAV